MSNQNRRLNYLFTILFIISIIYTTLRLFSLQDDLILSSQVLDSSQIASLSPVLLQLYFAVGSVILTGIILMAFSFKSETIDSQLINVGRNDKTDGKDASDDSNKTNNDSHSTKDLGFVVEVLKKAKSFEDKLEIVLKTLCKKLELGQGAIYSLQETDGIKSMKFLTGYAFSIAESETISFEFGEGLVGQSAKEGELLLVDDIPEGYINIISGLGKSSPKHLLLLPLQKNDVTQIVVELASFTSFSKDTIALISDSFNLIVNPVNENDKKSNSENDKEMKEATVSSKKTKSKIADKKKTEES